VKADPRDPRSGGRGEGKGESWLSLRELGVDLCGLSPSVRALSDVNHCGNEKDRSSYIFISSRGCFQSRLSNGGFHYILDTTFVAGSIFMACSHGVTFNNLYLAHPEL